MTIIRLRELEGEEKALALFNKICIEKKLKDYEALMFGDLIRRLYKKTLQCDYQNQNGTTSYHSLNQKPNQNQKG